MSRHATPTCCSRRLSPRVQAPAASRRRQYRERDFGIGYGRSSGYGDTRRYASDWGAPRFRCG